MPRRVPHAGWLVLPLAFVLYFYDLSGAGLVGPDEPRYAAIGREMARSGDWVTPRLWGQPWFEKPALLYWMTATGFRLGWGPELAPRIPVALFSLAFLAFYWWILRREFGTRAAWLATLILGTCAGWIGFSQVAVTDLPLAAAFSAAVLLALRWIAKGDARWLPGVSAMLGLAVLAKGLVPVVLALPLVLRGRGVRDLLRPRVVAPFVAVAAPWYLLCYLRNGATFFDVFFRQQQFGRFVSPELQHIQPWWFYVPVLLAGLLPWSPLLGLLVRRTGWHDPRRVFLGAIVLFGFVFFSVSTNKLPGYLLPLLPAAAVLLGLFLEETADIRPWLAACALLLLVYPLAAGVLPVAVASGLSHAPGVQPDWTWLAPVAIAAGVWITARYAARLAIVTALAVCGTAGVWFLKNKALPQLDRAASARVLWSEISPLAGEVCIEEINRNWQYGLNYYSVAPLPDCAQDPRPRVIRQTPGEPPYVTSSALVDRSRPGAFAPLLGTK